nr:complex I subunit 5 family protein [Lachnospiraceae bacterium]
YVLVGSFMWFVSAFFSVEYNKHHKNRNRYYMFLIFTLGVTMGVFIAADLFTLFIMFELASLASFVWVVQEETEKAMKAGETYLYVAMIGGFAMLSGICIFYGATNTLSIEALLDPSIYEGVNKGIIKAAALLIFVGFGAKAGAFPIHVWLPQAHPVAPAPLSALLSGILTKIGIFGVLILSGRMMFGDSSWVAFVLTVGVITMFVGALLAVFSVDLKRILACSSVSQIGFILVGISLMGILKINEKAVYGAVLYMVNHSLFKLVLFITAGVVYMRTHNLDLNAIKGYGRNKKSLMFIYLCGALGISGIPLFSGYVSKTLVHEALVELIEEVREKEAFFYSAGALKAMEILFLFCGGLTLAYMLKIFFVLFIEKNKDEKLQEKYDADKDVFGKGNFPILSVPACLFIVFGVLPNKVFMKLGILGSDLVKLTKTEESVNFFSLENLKGSFISIAVGLLVYFVFVKKVLTDSEGNALDRWPSVLSIENIIYRPAFKILYGMLFYVLVVFDRLTDGIVILLRKTVFKESPIPVEKIEGNAFTHFIGQLLDRIMPESDEANRRIYTASYRHKAALYFERVKDSNMIITSSLSFGLFFVVLGIVVTLIYMLWL